jgi:uncharacterized protein YndB with AHSA1/START domain
MPTDPSWSGGLVHVDRRTRTVECEPSDVFAAISRLGGHNGWHGGEWLWRVRGVLDTVTGGVGMRRGRVDPDRLQVGDPLDFWRVEAVEPNELVRLRAEMRLPGEAWLEWRIEPDRGATVITQTARFHPRGLSGRAYWYGVAPFHRIVFPGLLSGIVRDARTLRATRGGDLSARREQGRVRGRPGGCAPTA